MKRLCLLFFLTFFMVSNGVFAQFLGSSSNYSGSRGLAVNPSLMTTSYVYADLGLNLNFSVYNDFAFIHASDYWKLLNGNNMSDYYVNGKKYPIGFVINKNPKYVYETLDFNVISGMYSPNGKRAFGFYVNNRVYTNGTRVPWEIPEASVVTLEDGDYIGKNYKSEDSRFGMMAWSEVGLSYSSTVYERYDKKIDVGVTLKGLIGYAGLDVDLNEVDKDILSKDSVCLHKLDMTAAMSAPVNYTSKFSEMNFFNPDKLINGYGVGFDIGITYTRKKDNKVSSSVKRPCNAPRVEYFWRLGLSLLDVGAISYNNNARIYRFQTETDKIFDISRLEGVGDFSSLIDTVSLMINDNAGDAYVGSGFMMGLPTAVSLQFDYNIYKSFYANVTWLQPLRLFERSAFRQSMLVVKPRYESMLMDISVPVTLYNYDKIFVGFEARLAFFAIGTHNIFNYIGIGDSNGLDVYIALKFNLYKGRCFGGVRDTCWNADFR